MGKPFQIDTVRSRADQLVLPLPVQPPISTIGRCTSSSVAWIAAWRSAL
jgi:hypothetical protein